MPEDRAAKQAEFAEWALPHLDHIHNASRYLARNPDDADDLFQETFLRAYRFWHQFTPGTNCRAWLLTILYNTFRNRHRDRFRQQATVDIDDIDLLVDPAETGASSPTPERLVLDRLLDDEVQEAMQQLPPDFLQVVMLVDMQELSYEEAAAVLECPIGTVRSRLSRGRRLLYRSLEAYARDRGYLRR